MHLSPLFQGFSLDSLWAHSFDVLNYRFHKIKGRKAKYQLEEEEKKEKKNDSSLTTETGYTIAIQQVRRTLILCCYMH